MLQQENIGKTGCKLLRLVVRRRTHYCTLFKGAHQWVMQHHQVRWLCGQAGFAVTAVPDDCHVDTTKRTWRCHGLLFLPCANRTASVDKTSFRLP